MESRDRLDDLCVNGWGVYQNPDDWRFSADTVYLADFCGVRPRERILDLGMGDGALAFLLLAREESAVCTGIECREAAVARAIKGIGHNGLQERCAVIQGRVEDCRALLKAEDYTLVAANPPYAGKPQTGQKYASCRVMAPEALLTWCRAAQWALKNRGRMCVVYPGDYIQDMLSAMKQSGLALKRLELIRTGNGCRLFLAEAVKGARPGGAVIRMRDAGAEKDE